MLTIITLFTFKKHKNSDAYMINSWKKNRRRAADVYWDDIMGSFLPEFLYKGQVLYVICDLTQKAPRSLTTGWRVWCWNAGLMIVNRTVCRLQAGFRCQAVEEQAVERCLGSMPLRQVGRQLKHRGDFIINPPWFHPPDSHLAVSWRFIFHVIKLVYTS